LSVIRLSKFDIRKGQYLDFIQEMMVAPVSLPLHPSVMKVIKEYNGELPRSISNDKYNDYIKKVCKLAGVEDEVQGTKAEVIKMRREVEW